MGDQAADGVETVLGQAGAKDLIDRTDVGVACHPVAAIGQAVYAQQPQQPGAAPGSGDGGPASPGGPGPVIDAEFKDSE